MPERSEPWIGGTALDLDPLRQRMTNDQKIHARQPAPPPFWSLDRQF